VVEREYGRCGELLPRNSTIDRDRRAPACGTIRLISRLPLPTVHANSEDSNL
jgi:hypothetical protein